MIVDMDLVVFNCVFSRALDLNLCYIKDIISHIIVYILIFFLKKKRRAAPAVSRRTPLLLKLFLLLLLMKLNCQSSSIYVNIRMSRNGIILSKKF
jgi:hypothetical protein